ncbi:hypothetical protein H696_02899 [Fonticula alba]|uniref:ER membrane protein complex subunit 1 n=1 Tax=Fonticula alba TaxID=691883 RepID=A0A058Z9H5_FONAL|nr:hypothetical protein H696_02899 [Fonticula alba]KCV70553.1 hypothetical protein H696_02899 [Fonticula alba]|eukprot:XP_009495069.1 hypothetical protein H696_02899 [Fonticula alba]
MARRLPGLLSGLLLFGLLAGSFVRGVVFEDQAGRFEWARSFVGRVDFATFTPHSLVVASTGGVVAALPRATDSPAILWRHVLDTSEHVVALHTARVLRRSASNELTAEEGSFVATVSEPAGAGRLVWRAHRTSDGVVAASRPLLDLELDLPPASTKATLRQVGQTLWVSRPQDAQCFAIDVEVGTVSVTPCSQVPLESPTATDHSLAGGLDLIDGDLVTEATPCAGVPNIIHIPGHSPGAIRQFWQDPAVDRSLLLQHVDGTLAYFHRPNIAGPDVTEAIGHAACIANLHGLTWSRAEGLVMAPVSHMLLDMPGASGTVDAPHRADVHAPASGGLAGVTRAILTRWASDIRGLAALFRQAAGLGVTLPETQLKADPLGVHKLLVILNAYGRIFGLASSDGSLLWQGSLPLAGPAGHLAADGRLPPGLDSTSQLSCVPEDLRATHQQADEATIFLRCSVADRAEDLGLLQRISLSTGALAGPGEIIPFVPVHIMTNPLLAVAEAGASRQAEWLLVAPGAASAMTAPAGRPLVAGGQGPDLEHRFFLADHDANTVTGYGLRCPAMGGPLDRPAQLWRHKLTDDRETLVTVAAHSPGDMPASIGRILPDRNVLYKYLNPTAVAIVSRDASGVLCVRLVDAFSGRQVFYQKRERSASASSVQALLRENWLILTYSAAPGGEPAIDQHPRSEGLIKVDVLEFFESSTRNARGDPTTGLEGILPHAEEHSFLLPYAFSPAGVGDGEALQLASSVTRHGITNRQIVFALPQGFVLSLSRRTLSPRLGTAGTAGADTTAPAAASGPRPPTLLSLRDEHHRISLNHAVPRPHACTSVGTQLESTSIVAVLGGLDLFVTARLSPVQPFDTLSGEGGGPFSKSTVAITVLALVLVNVVLSRASARRALQRAWA